MIAETERWLQNMGLQLNNEKSILKDGREGFCFLGFHIIQLKKAGRLKIKIDSSKIKKAVRFKIKIHPSRASQIKFLTKIRSVIQKKKAASSSFNLSKTTQTKNTWVGKFL